MSNPWFDPMTPQGNSGPSGGGPGVPPVNEIYSRLVTAMNRILQLEDRVKKLESALQVSLAGDVELKATGTLTISSDRKIAIEGGQQGLELSDWAGNAISVASTGITVRASAKLHMQSSMFTINTGFITASTAMSTFSGTVKCDTIIARTVIGSSYTPGAGNIW
ncbi:MAG: hypothetical protein M9913_22990 [Bryobacteraceae bacterium]|nr:hypothetical protein [Solibacteraceae bacterium]MCL4844315.1 hypothetical protein [Bryobacteraceae bacterium]MCO5353705.1 hypothetical protein [Bryobacteraceae bacterium]